jgi:hypothetical protein
MAMIFTDAKEATNPIVFANDSFVSLTAFNRAEIQRRGASIGVFDKKGCDRREIRVLARPSEDINS